MLDISNASRSSSSRNGTAASLEWTIHSDPDESRSVQETIEQTIRAHGYADKEVFGICMALEEALVNAIKHGNQCDRAKKVHVACSIGPERFEVRIRDEGSGFDPGDVANPLAPENIERPSGRGLLLMRHYMTEVQYLPPGNQLSMLKVRTNGTNGTHHGSK